MKVRWHLEHSKDRAGGISNLALRGWTDEPAEEARLPGDGTPLSENSLPREDDDREELGKYCA